VTGEGLDAGIRRSLAELVSADDELAADLVHVLRAYIAAETRHVEIDEDLGRDVAQRVNRLNRLGIVLAHLELELEL
jgi:hypothetical protein